MMCISNSPGYFTAVSLFKLAQSNRGRILISEVGPKKAAIRRKQTSICSYTHKKSQSK